MGAYPPIEHHAVIGDLRTIALVAIDGTIDFLCLPSFDSPTVFASLLDAERGGCFRIVPELVEATPKQLYLPDTNVLFTRFLAADGVAEISDFMPIGDAHDPVRVVRRLKAVRGTIHARVSCAPRFDYGRANHTLRIDRAGATFSCPKLGSKLRLDSSIHLERNGADAEAEITLEAGETATFVLEYGPSRRKHTTLDDAALTEQFKQTVNFWREWLGKSTYRGRWRDVVNRSALVLKLLQSRDTGSLVAAPTFGLPELIGGSRNWDYRYTWIRDASFTLYALIRLGLTDETRAFIKWIIARCEEVVSPGDLQTCYGLDGRSKIPEKTLPHLSGYLDSRPVRIGNEASSQLQLDIYGELIDALYLYDKYGEPTSYDLWRHIAELADWVSEHWDQPDNGIWEVRTEPRHFLYSRVLCWVALDRALRLAEKRSYPAPVPRWRDARDAIHRDIHETFWNEDQQAFVGVAGGTDLDASCLIMPLVRFISPTDPRWLSTLRAVERVLADDSLVRRYEIEGPEADGLEGPEGTFSVCSFWFVECLSRSGDLQKARFYFEKLLGYANHVGLYAEEIGPRGEQLGNFPQALTHLGLISAAYDLNRRLEEAGWRA